MVTAMVSVDWDRQTYEFEMFLAEQERARQTIQSYMTSVRLLKSYLYGDCILNKQNLITFKEKLWERYKPATCNARIAGVNAFLNFIGAANLRLKQFKSQQLMARIPQKYLTKEEYQSLVGAALKMGKERLALGMETIASTGARISELRFFTVENVRQGQIIVRNKGKVRVLIVPDILAEKLMDYAEKHEIHSGSIFITSSGKTVDRSNFWREMHKLKEMVRIETEKLFPHNLRHFFAHTYYEETKDLVGLSDILGHSSLNVTRIYTQKTLDMQRKTLDMISILMDKDIYKWCLPGTKKTT